MSEPTSAQKEASPGASPAVAMGRPAPVAFVPRRRRRRARWVVAVLVLAAAGYGASRLFFGKGGGGDRRYATAKVERGAIEEGVTATGTVQAVETVEVGALVSGRILSLGAEDNAEVKAGQLLAVIDPEPYQARVEQAEAQLQVAVAAAEKARAERRRAERERDRLAQLGERGALGVAEVDDAEAAVELARATEKAADAEVTRSRAALKAAKLDLGRTRIQCPIDGIVLARKVEVGQSVTAGFQTPTLYTIARDLSEMEVRAAIDEADIGKVREGQLARFTVDAYPGETFEGTIQEIKRSPTVTQNVVTYEALVRVANPDKKLWPGMTATVRVVTARRDDAVRVPNAALRFKPPKDLAGEEKRLGGKKRRVWRLAAGAAKPEPVEIEVGISSEEWTEATSGALAPDDELVTEILGEASGPRPEGGGGRGPTPGPGGGGRMRQF